MVRLVLEQAGDIVAVIDCDDRGQAEREAAHYAFMYAADGPVEIKEIKPRRRSDVGAPAETNR